MFPGLSITMEPAWRAGPGSLILTRSPGTTMALSRQLYVISDLHLGGVYDTTGTPGARGFRLCTQVPALVTFIDALTAKPAGAPPIELIINGDMVDFLAEREDAAPHFVPYTPDQDVAADKLSAILKRDQAFTDALHRFLEAGHRLVILLGNHDLELVLPAVRRRLGELLGLKGSHDFTFILDGEAYLVGDVLIEHGNRYDQFNVVNQDALRHVRSLFSRRQAVPEKYAFDPPAGSKMVATVINPIKEKYRFIDLLKPETGAVIPMLLALEPGYKSRLVTAVKLKMQASEHRMAAPAMPGIGSDIAAAGGDMGGVAVGEDIAASGDMGGVPAGHDHLREELVRVMGEEAHRFLKDIEGIAAPAIGSDISTADTIDETLGLVRLLFGGKGPDVEKRLGPLLQALRALRDDQSFARDKESDKDTWEAAQELAKNGIRHVVFGHTHMAKKVPLAGGGFYLNSGTWADVMEFPREIVTGTDAEAMPKVREFVEHIQKSDFTPWTLFRPTYVRLDIGPDGSAAAAELCDYSVGGAV